MRLILIETRTNARQAGAPNNAREHWHTTFQEKDCDVLGYRLPDGSTVISREGKRVISVPDEQIRYRVWELEEGETLESGVGPARAQSKEPKRGS